MNQKRRAIPPAWLRLDNAAKIYPAARTKGWMPMFRVSLTFTQDIDPAVLQQALENTLRRVPLFSYRLRRGLFWNFLEQQDSLPRVEEDARNPMLPFNLAGDGGFLFRLRYFRRRVALEVFHALTDGFGATTFLMTLAAEYLFLRHGVRVPAEGMVLDTRLQPQPQEWEDSFPLHARGLTRSRAEQSAWQLKGTRETPGFLRVITGVVPTENLLLLARSRKTTVNTLLAAVLMQALMQSKEASARLLSRRRPVKLSLPVNLRRYYPSRTLRNFSFYVNVPVQTGFGLDSLDELIDYITHYMGLETMEPLLNARFSANVKAERNHFLRLAPLFLKLLVLKLMYRATGERYVTSTLTNLGNAAMPDAMRPYVERMDLVLGPAQKTPVSAAVISACGKTCITFSRTIKETGVEKAFFTALVRLGLPVAVESN